MTTTSNKESKELERLTKFWMEYVSKDHHKDRDYHWYVEADYAYGDKPRYTAYHSGYIADHLAGDYRDTFEEAQTDLLNLIKQAIKAEQGWAEEVLADVDDWDEAQVEKATMISEVKL